VEAKGRHLFLAST